MVFAIELYSKIKDWYQKPGFGAGIKKVVQQLAANWASTDSAAARPANSLARL
jgi:hypothetical protein